MSFFQELSEKCKDRPCLTDVLFVFVLWHGQVIEELESWRKQMQQDELMSDPEGEQGASFSHPFFDVLKPVTVFSQMS